MEKKLTTHEIESSCRNLLELIYSQIHTLATFNKGTEADAELESGDIDYINQLLFI